MFDTRTITLATLALAVLGCGPDERGDRGNGGNNGGNNGGADAGPTTDAPGGNTDGCSDDAKLVYVVDENYQLSTFDPMTRTFALRGNLSCPAGLFATPFSMSIDRDANAWVLYSDGVLYKVDTSTMACTRTSWSTQLGLTLFGMGFSTDTANGTTDTLFVAGGSGTSFTSSTLARIDPNTLQAQLIGNLSGSPELTGTGSAELWGFFPSASGATIQKLDKATGAVLQSFPLTALAGEPTAWAFAFWGGDFWVFLQKDLESYTTVYQISGSNGQLLGQTPAPGRRIVGAGVSTCAPVIIF